MGFPQGGLGGLPGADSRGIQVRWGGVAVTSILIVDDNPDLRDLVHTILQRTAREVVGAGDAEEALRLLAGRSFDFMITDLTMPGRSGIDLITQVREMYPGTRIVAMSGEWTRGDENLLKRAAALGVRAHLTKPFSMQHLINLLGSAEAVPNPVAGAGPIRPQALG